jgi:hypothetical protein
MHSESLYKFSLRQRTRNRGGHIFYLGEKYAGREREKEREREREREREKEREREIEIEREREGGGRKKEKWSTHAHAGQPAAAAVSAVSISTPSSEFLKRLTSQTATRQVSANAKRVSVFSKTLRIKRRPPTVAASSASDETRPVSEA